MSKPGKVLLISILLLLAVCVLRVVSKGEEQAHYCKICSDEVVTFAAIGEQGVASINGVQIHGEWQDTVRGRVCRFSFFAFFDYCTDEEVRCNFRPDNSSWTYNALVPNARTCGLLLEDEKE